MKDSNRYVECPQCGAQYHPAELYIPKSFFGSPSIVKDSFGKIVSCTGTPMDVHEKYQCDYCDSPLDINARVDIRVFYNKKRDVKKPHVTPLKHHQFTLKEDD